MRGQEQELACDIDRLALYVVGYLMSSHLFSINLSRSAAGKTIFIGQMSCVWGHSHFKSQNQEIKSNGLQNIVVS